MDHISSGSVCDAFPPLSSKYPWLVAQSLEDEEQKTQDLFFYTIHNDLPHYRCRIPELIGERIRGFYHGWMILSNHPYNNKWSLWNQETSKIIRLPTLVLEDGGYESIGDCCLSAPPSNPCSILLLTRTDKPTFVFFRLVSKRKKFRWIEMSYAYQLKRLTFDGKLVNNLTYCNGKVYALSFKSTFAQFILHVDITVWDNNEVDIKLMIFGTCPFPPSGPRGGDSISYLKGVSKKLFYIEVFFQDWGLRIPVRVHVFKSNMACIDWKKRECLKYWDLSDFKYEDEEKIDYTPLKMSRKTWKVINDLKNATFFVDLARDRSVSFRRVIPSNADTGGFIHIRGEMGETIYSYHVKTNTISLFHIPSPMLPTSHLSLWECRLKGDHGEAKCIIDSKVEMENKNDTLLRSGLDCGVESHVLNVPFNILETIMESSVGVEYMNLRATCKQCHLAAPLVKWPNDTSLGRLQTYSVVSPWLMVANKKRGIMTFTDPVLGGNYFLRKPHISIVYGKLYCSKFGWLLFKSYELNCLVFFNPFTNVIKDLPDAEYSLKSLCFSAPPTSLDCMVVGFSTLECWRVDILYLNREPTWRTLNLDPNQRTICFPTFYAGDLYALCKEGELLVINNLDREDYSFVEAEAPKGSCTSHPQYYLTNCDQHLLLVSVGEYGGHVEVFKRNESKQEWEKIDSVGKHVIFVCGTTCLCIEAKVPKMENKIFFPRLHTKNRKVVFYSLDTCKYHTFNGENIQEHEGGFFETTHYLSRNAWIEPCWS